MPFTSWKYLVGKTVESAESLPVSTTGGGPERAVVRFTDGTQLEFTFDGISPAKITGSWGGSLLVPDAGQ